jgi:hypothetical protein
MPWSDWQFWAVSLAALAGAFFVIRPLLPTRSGGSCRSCPADGAPPKPKRATLTIEGEAPGSAQARRD